MDQAANTPCASAVARRPRLAAATSWGLSARAAFVALVGLAAASTGLHVLIVGWVHSPRVFMDELGYERMAQTFAATGHFSLFGKAGLAYSPLYPIVLSPIYRLTSSMQTAYAWAKVENAVLISLAVFPIYGIARSVLSRGRAVGVAALSLVAPLMLYSTFEMSESLAYPLCLVAIWGMLRALRRPSVGNDTLLLAAIALASAARLQLVVLVPAALTAILLVALLRHEVRRSISRHRLLFGISAVVLVAVLGRTAMNRGNLPLAGRYANVGTAHASVLRAFKLFFEHLGELDFAVGVIPFAAALLAGYALARSGFPRRALIFAAVALASTFWLLFEVAMDAAAFDTGSPGALPRIHERYLIYVMPFFFVALVAMLPRLRDKFQARRQLAIAIVAAGLPALIPFGTIINSTTGVDSFALQEFGTTRAGHPAPIAHATTLILALSVLLAAAYVLAAFQPFPSLAVLVTVVALLWMSTLELRGQVTQFSWRSLGVPAHPGWVDGAVGSNSDVSLVGGDGVQPGPLRQTAFWNRSITRVYYACEEAFTAAYGEEHLMSGARIPTRYAVVPAAWHVAGRVLARDPAGKLALVATPSGALGPSRPLCGS
jgi:hypothetical protein